MREGSIKIVELVRGELAFLAGLELYPLVYYIRIGIVVMVHDNCVNLHFLSRNTYGHNKEGMLISLVDGGRGGRLGDRHSVIFFPPPQLSRQVPAQFRKAPSIT